MIGKLASHFCGPGDGATASGVACFELPCRPEIPLVKLTCRVLDGDGDVTVIEGMPSLGEGSPP